ncbi:cellulose synthase (UDP-forming) [Streptomyces sp. 1114.5]|uniref:glycosyltransferase family 2 protein n=1 Tax=Streptomyces sp. 1114.5 TaxID=1938830 RepID=UPI000F2C6CF4|nr:cellulose synthase catalytic subunit [Streptomyces sp. 1114.5]RKT19659.1 cellulose synthase (UDP-forming) [Streptomyces sp. 1114.5]
MPALHGTAMPAPDAGPRPTPPDPDLRLPRPPDDEELYWYFGPQRRWVLLCATLSYAGATATLGLFALSKPLLWPFLLLTVLNAATWLLSLTDGQRARRYTRDSHDLLMRAWQPAHHPGVDLLLPTAGEPLAVLDNAYRHTAAVRWPGELTVLVLDDADRPEVRRLAESYGFQYRARPDRGRFKKAGNLNHGLAEGSGEIIAVLDADFCPRPDFLHHLVPYLDNPGVGIVQSPQCFDTDADMSWLERAAGATQEIFYRWIQPSRDAQDGTVCCGTNALYRRAALQRIGGFAEIDHSEDLYTGLALARAGWATRYVPALVAKGMSPTGLPAFISQQYRWCLGSLALVRDPGFRRGPLSKSARLCFWNGILGYVTSAVNVFAVPLPALIMLFFRPAEIAPWQVLPFLPPIWVALVLLPAMSRTRWRFEVTRVQLLGGLCHIVAIAHALRRRSADWVPTGAVSGGSSLARAVARIGVGWLGFVVLAGAAGLVRAALLHGWRPYWALAALLALTAYTMIPLIRALWPLLNGANGGKSANGGKGADGGKGAAVGEIAAPARGRSNLGFGRAEAVAVTAVLLLCGLLASGWADPLIF